MNAIFERVSIRKYKDQDVEKEKIMQILRAAMQAPSAGDQQPWEFIIVRDRQKLEALSHISKYSGPVSRAPLAIVNIRRKTGLSFPEVSRIDMAICTEHEWLQAAELGLGAVWIGVAPFEDRVQMAGEILCIPEDKEVFSILPLGYPDQDRKQKDRFHEDRISEI